MHYATIKKMDIANGTGLRVSLFVSGCQHRCKGCFNQEAWDPHYGEIYNRRVEIQILEELRNPYVEGLSLLGGDPLDYENYKSLLRLVHKTKEMGKNIWLYTGMTLEELCKKLQCSHATRDLMEEDGKSSEDSDSTYVNSIGEFMRHIDVLVEGPFIEDLKDPMLKFRGSSNQRVIQWRRVTRKCYLHDGYYDMASRTIKVALENILY